MVGTSRFLLQDERREDFYEVMYFPDTNVCIIAKFSYRDLQSFKRLGDFDTDTRIATGDDAQKCIGILK